MLKRLFGGGSAPAADAPDQLQLVEKLLRLKSAAARSQFVLSQLVAAHPGDVRGFVVRREDADTGEAVAVEAVEGYPEELLALRLEHGPWRDGRARVMPNLIAELFTPNRQEQRAKLGELGLREANSALFAPVGSDPPSYGALVLTRHDGEAFGAPALALAQRWGDILGRVQASQLELERTRKSLFEFTRAFMEAAEAEEFSQLGHANRVTAYAMAIGRALGLKRKQLADLYFAAMLHDVGKLGLAASEREDESHPLRGANLVASSALLGEACDGIRSHHERWDGQGYPIGLRKEEIPLLGRIVAVADQFDLLSSERGRALSLREVEKELERRSGKELDPELVRLFVNVLRQGRSTQELTRLELQELPF